MEFFNQQIVILTGTKLEEIEKQAILATLKLKENNRTHTAKTLGIGIRTLQRKLRQYGIGAPEARGLEAAS